MSDIWKPCNAVFYALVALVVSASMLPTARAQFVQQGSKLVGTGGMEAEQGASVALSADGNTALLGGPNENAAWVFTRSGNVWTQQGAKLVGTGAVLSPVGSLQGTSVALSSNGRTAIVGGNQDNYNTGAAWVYTLTGGVWTQDR